MGYHGYGHGRHGDDWGGGCCNNWLDDVVLLSLLGGCSGWGGWGGGCGGWGVPPVVVTPGIGTGPAGYPAVAPGSIQPLGPGGNFIGAAAITTPNGNVAGVIPAGHPGWTQADGIGGVAW